MRLGEEAGKLILFGGKRGDALEESVVEEGEVVILEEKKRDTTQEQDGSVRYIEVLADNTNMVIQRSFVGMREVMVTRFRKSVSSLGCL